MADKDAPGGAPPVNRLEGETSPYLRQHRHNPVDWYPWGAEALELARQQNRPILLSIGYSTCHWCHVMARESFADPATASLMNQHFVNIKVDREERPDLDKVYQLAHQVLTRSSGGWPLTMFLDPQTLVPFFGGTYFPPKASYQLPGFSELLLRLSEGFREQHEELSEQGAKLTELLGTLGAATSTIDDDAAPADWAALTEQARDALAEQYDSSHGGFGSAPKFPNLSALTFLLERWALGGKQDSSAFDMAIMSLTRMMRGGIYDHLGGGLCRYSTDRQWMIPHFEKMLYDNGALLRLLSDALRVGPDQLFEDALEDTVGWLLRDMQDAGGAFYAAMDADSEGEEGRYYLWQRRQVKRLLTEDEYLLIETLYGLDKPANFESRWNLHRHDAWHSVVQRIQLDSNSPRELLQSARNKLMAERSTRTAPAIDDKVLAGWNGLVADGLANAGMHQRRPEWVAAAQGAMDFVQDHLFVSGRLYATWSAGAARHPAYLDDYAFCLQALVSLLQASWRERDAAFAVQLANHAVEHFAGESGGFYFTADDHESLIHRPMPTIDDATVSGNAALACALHDLGHLMGNEHYLGVASSTLEWAARFVAHYPAGHCGLLGLAQRFHYPQQQVLLRGPVPAEWIERTRQGYRPHRRVYHVPFDDARTLPGYLPRMVSMEARTTPTAYVCTGLACSAPVTSLDALIDLLA